MTLNDIMVVNILDQCLGVQPEVDQRQLPPHKQGDGEQLKLKAFEQTFEQLELKAFEQTFEQLHLKASGEQLQLSAFQQGSMWLSSVW